MYLISNVYNCTRTYRIFVIKVSRLIDLFTVSPHAMEALGERGVKLPHILDLSTKYE
jgi:hypothetical protein